MRVHPLAGEALWLQSGCVRRSVTTGPTLNKTHVRIRVLTGCLLRVWRVVVLP